MISVEQVILDTNVLSELMRPQPEPSVMNWFAARPGTVFYTTAIVQAEIMLGIAMLPAGKRRDALTTAAEELFTDQFGGRCIPFEARCAAQYAAIVSARRRAGFSITTEDAQIAAIALCCGYPLATRNTRDFMHVDGLSLYNPWLAGGNAVP